MFACAACGRINFDSLAADASPADAECTAFGPFSTPLKLDAVLQSPADDWFPTPSVGGTQLYYYTFRAPSQGAAVWVAERATSSSPFAAASRVSSLDTADDEAQPTLTDDGLYIVFASKPSAGQHDLYASKRMSPTDAWGAPIPLTILNSASSDFTPWISGDGLRLWFSSARSTNFTDLYEATRMSRAVAFEAPQLITELVSSTEDQAPTLSYDGLELFFVSGRAGGPGMFDVYTARRPSLGQPFTTPQVVPELSSARDEYGLRLSPDGTTMFLNYDTLVNGGGNADMWTATRACQ